MASLIAKPLLAVLVAACCATCIGAEPVQHDPATLVHTDDLEFPELYSNWFDSDAIPDRIRELDGRRVRIHGTMFPPLDERTVKFLLIGDTKRAPPMNSKEPGFFQPLEVHERIGVSLKTPIDYTNSDPIVVEGVLRIFPRMRGSDLKFLYIVEDATAVRTERLRGEYSGLRSGC
jgi:hypothetical protein